MRVAPASATLAAYELVTPGTAAGAAAFAVYRRRAPVAPTGER